MYNVHKPLTTIFIIFVYFIRFFSLGSSKTDRSGWFIGFLSDLLIQLNLFVDLNFISVFNRFVGF
jgi:hypothetical protein